MPTCFSAAWIRNTPSPVFCWNLLQRATIQHGSRGLRSPALGQAQQGSQVMNHRLKATGCQPALCLLVDSFPRRQVVGQHPPGRSGAHDPPQGIEHFAQFVGTLRCVLADQG